MIQIESPFGPSSKELSTGDAISSPQKSAFTLIELLTVIAIIGILAAILIPVVGLVREGARASKCISNLRQIGQAIYLYAEDHNGTTPPARNQNETGLGVAFHYTLWPYLAGPARESFVGGSYEARAISDVDNVFLCPSTVQNPIPTPRATRIFNESTGAWYSYTKNILPSMTLMNRDFNTGTDNGFPIAMLDTPTRTVAVFESSFWYGHGGWYHTRDGLMPHNEASNFLFYDGSVKRVPYAEVPEYSGLNSGRFWGGNGPGD